MKYKIYEIAEHDLHQNLSSNISAYCRDGLDRYELIESSVDLFDSVEDAMEAIKSNKRMLICRQFTILPYINVLFNGEIIT
jgi:hypothetical protein